LKVGFFFCSFFFFFPWEKINSLHCSFLWFCGIFFLLRRKQTQWWLRFSPWCQGMRHDMPGKMCIPIKCISSTILIWMFKFADESFWRMCSFGIGQCSWFWLQKLLEVDSRRKLLEMYDRRGFESCACSRKGCMQNKEYR
jgi:hypothetical protein